MTPDLTVAVTSWDDAAVLPTFLDSVQRTTEGVNRELIALDNCSSDASADLLRAAGAAVHLVACRQPEALDHLLALARGRYLILAHTDIVFLSTRWFELCRGCLENGHALVSPEDLGLGPGNRAHFGADMPESSFMFFDTAVAQRLRRVCRSPRRLFRLLRRFGRAKEFDFRGPHVTHNIPRLLQQNGLTWQRLEVLTSPTCREPWYENDIPEANWTPDWGRYTYGFGNFYRLEGELTHYHQWYARSMTGPAALGLNDLPVRFLRESSERFRRDYAAGTVRLPSPNQPALRPTEAGAPTVASASAGSLS